MDVKDEFVGAPSLDLFHRCTKDSLVLIAEHYDVPIVKQAKKQEIKAKVWAGLVEKSVLPEKPSAPSPGPSEQRLSERILMKQLELESQKIASELKQKELQLNSELEIKRLEEGTKRELEMKRLEVEGGGSSQRGQSGFDVSRNIRMVPPFSEKDVDKYFILFERVATSLKWPKDVWTMLLQCVLIGKARDAYSSLSVDNSLNYDMVKAAVLRAYEMVPEAYRQKFRRFKKHDNQTYVDFAREKEALFERWCASQGANDFVQLKSLMIMEDFKNCLPDRISTYINEQKVSDVSKAAVLADEFVLTHKTVFGERSYGYSGRPVDRGGNSRDRSFPVSYRSAPLDGNNTQKEGYSVLKDNDAKTNYDEGAKDGPMCFYCKKMGHIVAQCNVLKRKNAKPVVLVKTQHTPGNHVFEQDDLAVFAPFVMEGFVSMEGIDKKVPVKILRDTAASQSFILEDVLPFSVNTSMGSDVPVMGFGMENLGVPLHTISLESELVTGCVAVGIRPQFPIKGVSMILGNDLAGGKVLVTPDVKPIPMLKCPDEFAQKYPRVFASCAVTRAMSRKAKNDEEIDLSDSFMTEQDGGFVPVVSVSDQKVNETHLVEAGRLSLSRDQLIAEQKNDQKLSCLFNDAVSEGEVESVARGVFLKDGLLMRKWSPLSASVQDDWTIVKQIVVPHRYRSEILSMAHDNLLAGHLGVNKTYDRILRHFFWPGLKKDVVQHCRSCHICQVAGKPNQTIAPAPLYPIPVVGEPFERIIIDCVGPLPRTKSGNKFLLSIMCASTRFPEVVPLRNIKAPAIVKALTKFFSLFGLPKVIQSDQGSNFMSRVFAQVLKQLDIKHCHSSAYHPESQGALERFHQTLKSMLRTYCLEFDKDWDDGVHLMMFAVREVVQESLGFSPADLVFAHSVRGPLKLVKEKWLQEDTKKNVLDFVSNFRFRLRRACELAMENLNTAQTKMKLWFDRSAKSREFSPGDKVLVLLPIPGSSLQARYSGPYRVERKMGERDYLIATPDRKRRNRLCHVNMLKEYHDRDVNPHSEELSSAGASKSVLTTVALSSAEVMEDCLSEAVTHGKLSNSEALQTLDSCLSHLTESQRGDVVQLVGTNRSLFSDVPTQTCLLKHDIDVGGTKSIKQHPYRVNPEKRRRLKKQVDYMLQHDIAEPSCSPWSSPCLLVLKANGEDRFCTDFRKVNDVTIPDSYPLPRMEDCIDHVGCATFVSKLDLLKGYWQVPLTERAKNISAFVTPDDFLQYTVMAFGMRNAPATFQRLVNVVLSGLSFCEAYLDDLVVCSRSWAEHLDHLRVVFKRLADANLTINLGKCEFGQATVTYLGKVVGRGCVRTIQSKVEAIVAFPAPTSRTELRRYLAMVGYYRGFCDNFSSVAAPLTNMLSPKVSFKWTEGCQKAFSQTKSVLMSAPVLAAPDFDKPFKLAVDASDSGVGGVLLQDGSDGVEHPVCYFSKKFKPYQKWYSTIEKEALALILALDHFEVYVGSSSVPLVVYTDHNPLVFLQRMRNKNRRLMNWSLELQAYNLEIRHIRGKDNVLADALSRQ